jgi:uncharacterized protein YndB with AHSA1/START domain
VTVIHDTFRIERTYPATSERVFAAFASEEAKNVWGDTGDLGETGAETEFDFRPGGRERFGFEYKGVNYRYDALYYDIVPNRRIIYSYEMYADDTRISVSVATIEFTPASDGPAGASTASESTALTVTEQGAYLDGFDGPDAAALRREGITEMLDNLTGYLKDPSVGEAGGLKLGGPGQLDPAAAAE